MTEDTEDDFEQLAGEPIALPDLVKMIVKGMNKVMLEATNGNAKFCMVVWDVPELPGMFHVASVSAEESQSHMADAIRMIARTEAQMRRDLEDAKGSTIQ